MSNKSLVIGAGFGGIASALRLKAKGYDVHVIDQCKRIGGRAQVYELEGYRHDAGPTVITAPFLLEELFSLFDKNISDYIKIVPIEPWYRFAFADGRHFDYGGTVKDTLEEINKFEPEDCENYLNLLETSRKIYEIGFEKLSDEPFHALSSMVSAIPHLASLKSYKTVWQFVSANLKNDYLRQAFSIQPLLVGGNPFNTTSIYSLIHFLERKYGIHFIMGGTGALVDALKLLMDEVGIKCSLGQSVREVTVTKGSCDGVVLEDGSKISADLVVSNADPAFLYSKMIAQKDQAISARVKTRFAKFSAGLFIIYFGTKKKYQDIKHHTIWLGKRYRELLDDIFEKKILPDDFSMYLHRPTATDPTFAPEGCDSFYVLIPVANLLGKIEWKVEGLKLQQRVIKTLSATLLPDLETHITASFFKTPEDFEETYSSLHGTGFSIAPTLTQSAWFRYHNKAEGIKNLFLCGAGTHPGAGLPGVLSSAKVLEKLIPRAS